MHLQSGWVLKSRIIVGARNKYLICGKWEIPKQEGRSLGLGGKNQRTNGYFFNNQKLLHKHMYGFIPNNNIWRLLEYLTYLFLMTDL